jgi:uncharacterized protein (DUF2267 family)
MTKSHVFDAHVDAANRWLTELTDNLDLSAEEAPRALRALRAGLHAIRDRLPASEVLDLGAQLPTLIRGLYLEGWTLPTAPRSVGPGSADRAAPRSAPRSIRDRAAMVARVKQELEPDQHLDPVDVLRAVIHLLVEHVSTGEIEDVLATLPKPIRELWHDLTGHALQAPMPPAHRKTMHRTGYSR